MSSFSGNVILVTGAASGIGAATAELFAKEGAAVIMVDKDESKLQLATERLKNYGRTTFAITANVANDDDVKRIFKETIDKFGKLNVLVNCAGLLRYGTILDGNLMQSYSDVINVNLRAVMTMTCEATPHLIKSKGNIVNISSIAASQIYAINILAYGVSKSGVKRFTRGAALELAPYGVRVNSISPGGVRTNIASIHENTCDVRAKNESLNKPKRICEPEEIAELVLYLASDKAKGITGSDFVIDNGLTLN